MKKMILVCAMGAMLSGCTVATVQTGVYTQYPRYNSVYNNPYVYYQPRHIPRCYTTYVRGYYGHLVHRRVCH
jgi:hypothetical protein